MPGRFNMHLKHSIALPGVPAEGEIGRVIVSGAPDREAAPNSTTARNPSGSRERSAASRTRTR